MENLYNLSRLCTVRPPVTISASDTRGETRPAPVVEPVDTQDLKSCSLKASTGSIPVWGTPKVEHIYSSMEMPYVYSWKEYISLPHIKIMSLTEQTRQYNYYVCEMNEWIMHNVYCDRGGASQTPRAKEIVNEGFLQQENLFYVLQEDGSRIYVTVEI